MRAWIRRTSRLILLELGFGLTNGRQRLTSVAPDSLPAALLWERIGTAVMHCHTWLLGPFEFQFASSFGAEWLQVERERPVSECEQTSSKSCVRSRGPVRPFFISIFYTPYSTYTYLISLPLFSTISI